MNEEQNIRETILALYQHFENTDEDKFRGLTHPQVRTVNIGNSGEVHVFDMDQIVEYTIAGLRRAKEQIPGFFARREEIEICHIAVQELIASAEVSYKMVMPESIGRHHSYLHLVKNGDQWIVVNMIDRGIEESKD